MAIPLLGMYPKEMKTYDHKKTCKNNVHSKQERTQMSIYRRWISKYGIVTERLLFSNKKRMSTNKAINMAVSERHAELEGRHKKLYAI